MQTFVDMINRYLTILGVPGTRVLGVAAIVALAVVVGRLLSPVVVRYIQRLLRRVDSDLDPDLIARLRQPIGWLIFLGGLRFAYLVVAESLGAEISQSIDETMGFATIVVAALLIYRSSSLLAEEMRHVALRSETGIDDLLVPYIPKFVEMVAVATVVIKAAEVFLGLTAAALAGLLGGAGLTLGLVFKDVLSDWFASLIIYADGMYRPNDTIELVDGSLGIVEAIGMRSTTVRTEERTNI